MTMQAVILKDNALELAEVPVPEPGPGEVLVKTLANGICGSDLHCVTHSHALAAGVKAVTGADLLDPAKPVVMGHEFCAEVVRNGPGTQGTHQPGARVVSPPMLARPAPVNLGFGGVEAPGGYAEYMVLTEALMMPVPDHLSSEVASLTEPLAVALHAVNRGALGADDVPVVIGCGPIGLAVIAVLKMRGVGPIIAADFSPARRVLAAEMGADIVVDPRETSPYDSWHEVAAVDDQARYGRQTALFPELPFRPSVVFECVGVPGVIQQVLAGAPACSRVVVAGLCMAEDTFLPTFGVLKEIDLVFSLYYSVEEFAQTLGHLAAGELRAEPLITGRVGLAGVPAACAGLADPEKDAKVVIVPGL
ncbi:zinc-binding dehydrogenase [Streptomyces sp. NBC_00006]|uniref:zinc-binding dehydrogenase n=1 Tax=unclassified Streptomyces TaxID=2593676 RepID=UPI00225BA835|nr:MULTISPECIES: zinc-binding dehydrogenase [unclassified Streptomyces]MCX5530023.1 zinc-binding dehydrogenase [Streptomyces sp. NBC_00006]